MKKLFVVYFLLIFVTLSKSQDYNFALGVTYQPFFYQNYNKSDWNNRPNSYPYKPQNFNGEAIGLVFGKPITEIFSLKGEFSISTQEQKHILLGATLMSVPPVYYYGWEVSTNFKIIKLPVLGSLAYELGYRSGLFVNIFGGPQISFVSDYTSIYHAYDSYYNGNIIIIDKNSLINEIIRTPFESKQTIIDHSEHPAVFRNYSQETDFIYNRWLFGIAGGFEIQKKIGSKILFGLGPRIEFDFTNSEKHPELTFPVTGPAPRPKTHNFRYGLTFTVMYLI